MTREAVSIVTPAYRAAHSLPRTVRSVLAQTVADWEMIVVADDGTDYAALLKSEGLSDPRIRYLATGNTGSGSPPARNMGLDAARHRYAAILDADDLFHPEKLEHALKAVKQHDLVSTALQIAGADLRPLRTVGEGPDRLLDPGTYKFTNISMDSMLVYDRRIADPRFDPGLPRLTDIDFLLRLFATHETCFHLGTALHTYVKEPESVSNTPGASQQIVTVKHRILDHLRTGRYPLALESGRAGLIDFYERSLAAEQAYGALLAENPAALFEDHLEKFLTAAATSPA